MLLSLTNQNILLTNVKQYIYVLTNIRAKNDFTYI